MDKEKLIELVQKSQAGDRKAQESLIMEVQDSVFYQCRKMLGNQQDAEDAAQDILIQMLGSLPSLKEPAAFWGWLNRSVANRCKNKLSREKKDRQIPEDEEGNSLLDTYENLDDQLVPDKALDNEETQRMMMELVDALPDAQRMCVMLYYYDEMPVKEIAAALEVSENTVKSRLNYARRSIKEGVEKYEKQGIKLYGVSPLPFLLYFLQREAQTGGLGAPAKAAMAEKVLSAGAGAMASAEGGAGTAAVGAVGRASAGGRLAALLAQKTVRIVLSVAILGGACGGIYFSRPSYRAGRQYDSAVVCMEQEDYQGAIDRFTAVIDLDPDRADAYIGRGNAYIWLAETEENLALAEADYTRAIELAPENEQGYLGLADVAIRQGEFEAAEQVLERGAAEAENGVGIQKKLEQTREGNITDSSGKTRRRAAYDGAHNLLWWHDYAYDAEGRQSSVTSYDSDGVQTGHVDLTYNEDGQDVWTYARDKSTGAVMPEERFYNQQGQHIKTVCYNEDGEILSIHKLQYDSEGRCTESTMSGKDGDEYRKDLYFYDAEGRRIKYEAYYRGKLEWYQETEYNGQDIRKDSHYDAEGNLEEYTVYVEDEEGKIIGRDCYDASGALIESVRDE